MHLMRTRLNMNERPLCRKKLVDGYLLGVSKEVDEKEKKITVSHVKCDHSWLETPDGAILDPNPVGCITWDVLLCVAKGTFAPYGKNLYLPCNEVTKEVSNRNLWRESQVIYKIMKKAKEIHKGK